jgi:periplasmic protein TonB
VTQRPVFVEGIFTLRNLRSMGAAAAVEVLLALGLAAILIWQQLRPPVAVPMSVGPPTVEFQSPPQRRNLPVPKQPEQTAPLHQVQAIPTDVPTPLTEPLQAPLPPLLSQSQPPQGLVSDFGGKVLRAINAQKVYPKLQLIQGVTGEAVISFDYVDGVVSDIRVDKSSGSHELDQAAMQAVQRAVLPPKPAELSGLDHFVFTLAFDLGR